jgi:hypothetical protein
MPQLSKRTEQKIGQPEIHYRTPNDIIVDHNLSHEEKKDALSTWEQDARQLLTAGNEGMPGRGEGTFNDNHRLGEVIRARSKLGEPPMGSRFATMRRAATKYSMEKTQVQKEVDAVVKGRQS